MFEEQEECRCAGGEQTRGRAVEDELGGVRRCQIGKALVGRGWEFEYFSKCSGRLWTVLTKE